MGKNESSKLKVIGRPIMEVVEKKSDYIKFRVNEGEKRRFKELHHRFGPNLSEAEFARAIILNKDIVAFGIRDLDEKEKEMLHEIALLGNQFKMVASRTNITILQEKRFQEDSQKIREILTSTHAKVLEYQKKELHYFKIGEVLKNFDSLINSYENNQEIIIDELKEVHNELSLIYQAIIKHQK